MQSAMWLILGGTVGLAALLDRHQHLQMSTTLGPPVQCGDIRLQLPAHWMVEYSDLGMITARDPGIDPPWGRKTEVTTAPPAEHALIDQLLQRDNPGPPRAITFGPAGSQAGSLYVWQANIDQDGQIHPFGRVVATTILPNGPEVTIRLEHLDLNEQAMDFDDDINLVRRIAATVQFAPTNNGPIQD